ncbi:MAG: cyclin family protein, partial [Candidatus Micrarchaeaceae archaeon]
AYDEALRSGFHYGPKGSETVVIAAVTLTHANLLSYPVNVNRFRDILNTNERLKAELSGTRPIEYTVKNIFSYVRKYESDFDLKKRHPDLFVAACKNATEMGKRIGMGEDTVAGAIKILEELKEMGYLFVISTGNVSAAALYISARRNNVSFTLPFIRQKTGISDLTVKIREIEAILDRAHGQNNNV